VDGQLPMVHQGQAVGKLVRLIRELRPDVLITFGPDGIYGHYDHIAAHRWATIAVDLAAAPDCFPDLDLCDPHQVSKLYYRALVEEQVAEMAEDDKPAAVMMDGVPFHFVGRPEGEITTVIDVGDHGEAKLAGIRCHSTQVGRDNRFAREADGVVQEEWFRQETFVLARSTVGPSDGTETDLLRGLR
jgi:N-acetyl-1-D-myo-inositol-2-amino-2-deoxy-alpha-D-glucopyranoside deacetylase